MAWTLWFMVKGRWYLYTYTSKHSRHIQKSKKNLNHLDAIKCCVTPCMWLTSHVSATFWEAQPSQPIASPRVARIKRIRVSNLPDLRYLTSPRLRTGMDFETKNYSIFLQVKRQTDKGFLSYASLSVDQSIAKQSRLETIRSDFLSYQPKLKLSSCQPLY